MKKTVINLFILTFVLSFAFAQDVFVQTDFAPAVIGSDTLWGGTVSTGARGISAGSDLDQDGKKEVWATTYSNGGQVYCFEQSGTDTLELVWTSELTASTYGYGTRWVQTGDLDSDGKGEVIFFIGNSQTDPVAGLHVYEWDGSTDNGYGTTADFHVNFLSGLNDSLATARPEHFSVADIDGDGKEEIIMASNGGTNPSYGTQDGSTAYSEDRFIIMSVSGDIGTFGATIVEEYSMSPRDVDKDGTRENALGGGSPQGAVVCDTDGDGLLEAACFSWNNLAVFFIEATGPDAYTIGDTTYVKLSAVDDWTLEATAADMDGDGKDEVYVAGYGDSKLFAIVDSDGDANHLVDSTETTVIATGYSHGASATAGFGVFVGGNNTGTDINKFDLAASGNPLDSADWTASSYGFDNSLSGFVAKISSGFDFDGDGAKEVALAYMSVADSLQVIDGTDTTMVLNTGAFGVRVAEWDDGTVSIRDITTIMPDDYKLAQNYPNPFNPTTKIEYYLPVNNTISLTIYNMLGQEVVKLVNNQSTVGGSHYIVWNGTDKNGVEVGSGTYIYELKYGNFSKTRKMTLVK
jgi:flagellar hook assembly protein FlgD